MAMKSLDPTPEIKLENGWTLLATEAGRYKEGLRATTFLRNGAIRESQTLALSDPADKCRERTRRKQAKRLMA